MFLSSVPSFANKTVYGLRIDLTLLVVPSMRHFTTKAGASRWSVAAGDRRWGRRQVRRWTPADSANDRPVYGIGGDEVPRPHSARSQRRLQWLDVTTRSCPRVKRPAQTGACDTPARLTTPPPVYRAEQPAIEVTAAVGDPVDRSDQHHQQLSDLARPGVQPPQFDRACGEDPCRELSPISSSCDSWTAFRESVASCDKTFVDPVACVQHHTPGTSTSW